MFDFGFTPLLSTLLGSDSGKGSSLEHGAGPAPEPEQDAAAPAGEPAVSVAALLGPLPVIALGNGTAPAARQPDTQAAGSGEPAPSVDLAPSVDSVPAGQPAPATGLIEPADTFEQWKPAAGVPAGNNKPAPRQYEKDRELEEPERVESDPGQPAATAPGRSAQITPEPAAGAIPAPQSLTAPTFAVEAKGDGRLADRAPVTGSTGQSTVELAPRPAIAPAVPSEMAFAIRMEPAPAVASVDYQAPVPGPATPVPPSPAGAAVPSPVPDPADRAAITSLIESPPSLGAAKPEEGERRRRLDPPEPAPEPVVAPFKDRPEMAQTTGEKQLPAGHVDSVAPISPQPRSGTSPAHVKPEAPAPANPVAPPVPPKAGTAGQLSIRVERPGEKDVALQVMERAGRLHVAVRSDDSRLNTALRSDLNDLVSNLKHQGFKSEAWSPADTTVPISRASQDGAASSGSQSFREGGGYRQQQQQQRNSDQQEQPEWVDELESSFSSATNLHNRS